MEPISTVTLIQAGASAAKHAIRRTLSVICVLLVVGLIFLGVKRIIYPPKTESYAQTVQAGGQNFNIEVYNPEDTFFFGIKIFGFKVGISRPTIKKISEITDEVNKKVNKLP